MAVEEESIKSRYQIRCAAGLYWILDMEQTGEHYRKPLSVNEIGANICKQLMRGRNREEIADYLCEEYQAERAMVLQDIDLFQEQLRAWDFNPMR